jgi:hypothetical protein
MKKFLIPRVSIENVDIVPPEVEEPPFNVAGVEVYYCHVIFHPSYLTHVLLVFLGLSSLLFI